MTIFSCFDVETTGLNAKNDHVIEIAIVKVTADGELVDEWTSLVGPPRDLSRTEHIHNIKKEWLTNAPNFSQITGDICEKLYGSIPVAHNAKFDCDFIYEETKKVFSMNGLKIDGLKLDAFDTLSLAKSLRLPRKLVELTDALGIQLSNAHEALADTRALAKVLIKLLELSKNQVDSPVFQPSPFVPESTGLFKHRPSS